MADVVRHGVLTGDPVVLGLRGVRRAAQRAADRGNRVSGGGAANRPCAGKGIELDRATIGTDELRGRSVCLVGGSRDRRSGGPGWREGSGRAKVNMKAGQLGCTQRRAVGIQWSS